MWETSLYNTTKLTLELRDIVDNGENSVDIWNFEYPSFYQGEEKKAFERKVIDHYYFRQIGQETVGRWLHYFRSRIRDIMPYYTQLYESEKYMKGIEDPFATVDYTETFESETTGQTLGETADQSMGSHSSTNTSTNNGELNKEHRFSDTPQGTIDNLEDHMSQASKDKETNTDTVNGSQSGNNSSESTTMSNTETTGRTKHTLTKKGAMGVTTFGHDMIEYRQSFLNIDLMIIEDLNDLFLGVY